MSSAPEKSLRCPRHGLSSGARAGPVAVCGARAGVRAGGKGTHSGHVVARLAQAHTFHGCPGPSSRDWPDMSRPSNDRPPWNLLLSPALKDIPGRSFSRKDGAALSQSGLWDTCRETVLSENGPRAPPVTSLPDVSGVPCHQIIPKP